MQQQLRAAATGIRAASLPMFPRGVGNNIRNPHMSHSVTPMAARVRPSSQVINNLPKYETVVTVGLHPSCLDHFSITGRKTWFFCGSCVPTVKRKCLAKSQVYYIALLGRAVETKLILNAS